MQPNYFHPRRRDALKYSKTQIEAALTHIGVTPTHNFYSDGKRLSHYIDRVVNQHNLSREDAANKVMRHEVFINGADLAHFLQETTNTPVLAPDVDQTNNEKLKRENAEFKAQVSNWKNFDNYTLDFGEVSNKYKWTLFRDRFKELLVEVPAERQIVAKITIRDMMGNITTFHRTVDVNSAEFWKEVIMNEGVITEEVRDLCGSDIDFYAFSIFIYSFLCLRNIFRSF